MIQSLVNRENTPKKKSQITDELEIASCAIIETQKLIEELNGRLAPVTLQGTLEPSLDTIVNQGNSKPEPYLVEVAQKIHTLSDNAKCCNCLLISIMERLEV